MAWASLRKILQELLHLTLADKLSWSLSADESMYTACLREFVVRLPADHQWTKPIELHIFDAMGKSSRYSILQQDDEARLASSLFRAVRYNKVIRDQLTLPSSEQIYDVFLAYRAEDSDFAYRVAEDLVKRGLRVWFDQWEIKGPTTRSVEQSLRWGLKCSKVVLQLFVLVFPSLDNPDGLLPDEDRWYIREFSLVQCAPLTVVGVTKCGLEHNYKSEISHLAKELKAAAAKVDINKRVWADEEYPLDDGTS